MDLTQIREEINRVDDQLVKLFVERMELASQVAAYKKEHNMPIYVPAREREILKKVAAQAGDEFGRYTRLLYANIMDLSRSYQGKQNRTAAAKQWSFPDLIAEAEKCEDFPSIVDVNKACFLAPESMIDAIKAECAATNQPVPETVGQIMQCVYSSLSLCYKEAIKGLEALTGNRYTSINIVGGGCQDMYLNRRTAKATGLPVFAGPIEGTAIGNLVIQMIHHGDYENLQAARDAIRVSFEIKEVN